jgi:hypothetical protein
MLLNNALVETRGNTIVVRDTESNLLVAERIVADLDKPSRQYPLAMFALTTRRWEL